MTARGAATGENCCDR